MLELGELLLDRFDRAAHVGPQDDVERLHFARVLEPIEQAFQRDVLEAGRAERMAALLLGARLGDFARLGNVVQHVEAAARAGRHVEARDVHRNAGPGFFDAAVVVERVVHRLDAAVRLAAHDDVAHAQRAVLHEHLGDDAAVRLLLRFEARADRRPVRDWPCTRAVRRP